MYLLACGGCGGCHFLLASAVVVMVLAIVMLVMLVLLLLLQGRQRRHAPLELGKGPQSAKFARFLGAPVVNVVVVDHGGGWW